ncbi:MAG: DUF4375 domain-containing protein [Clostridia bacterium]|nr:DUF4375 domain-containing protein [Clostridia bacterium]
MGIYQNDEKYLQMSAEQLAALPDEEFFWAIMIRTERRVDGFEDWAEGVNALNPYQKVFYSVNWLDTEVNNGGLCQFFINSSRMVAPLMSEYLGTVGANQHQKLFDEFIETNDIDLADLSSFDSEDWEEVDAQYDRYPFDDFDDAYYDMEPLETYLTKYARENLAQF